MTSLKVTTKSKNLTKTKVSSPATSPGFSKTNAYPPHTANCKKFKNPFVSTSFFVCGCSKTLKHRPLTQKEEEEKKDKVIVDIPQIIEEVLAQPEKIRVHTSFCSIINNFLENSNREYYHNTEIMTDSEANLCNGVRLYCQTLTLGLFSFEQNASLKELINFVKWGLDPKTNQTIDVIDAMNGICQLIEFNFFIC